MKSFNTAVSTVIAIASLAWASGAFAAEADVTVTRAWVRATMPGQPVAGAYLDLEAKRALKLTGVASPVATRGEVHEMKHEDGMMKMRQVAVVDLPAGRKVQLAPGGLHVMLFGLQKPLEVGQSIPLTLRFRDAAGKTFERTLTVPVKPIDGGDAENASGQGDPGKH